MKITPVALTAFVYASTILPASADDALDPRNASAGASAELSSFNRDISVGNLQIDADGLMTGVQGHFQHVAAGGCPCRHGQPGY